MIQRIQTVYLFFAVAVVITMAYSPFAHIVTPDERMLSFYYNGLAGQTQSLFLLCEILLYILTLLLILIIALFRNRLLQIRLCGIALVILLVFTGLMAGLLYNYTTNSHKVFLGISSALPPVVMVLIYLARKAIRKDEELVRSADRIR